MKKLLIPLLIFSFLVTLAASAKATSTGFVKASWITRWAFKDKHDLIRILRSLKGAGVQIVFFQVRGNCDALYRSNYEPWCEFLTGCLGKDPKWDPLAEAIAQGKKLGIEVHAWVNLVPAWPVSPGGLPPSESKPRHVYLEKPDWIACDRLGRPMSLRYGENPHKYVFLSPTNPEVRDYLVTIIEDLVSRYRIKGIHFDYVRFPDSTYSYDKASLSEFKGSRDKGVSFAEWRRRTLSELVGAISYTARLTRPGIKVSATVVSDLDRARDFYLQDAEEWVKSGYVDFIVPLIYTADLADFESKLTGYLEKVPPDSVIVGIGAYLEGFDERLLSEQMIMARFKGVRGISVFNSDYAVRYKAVLKAN